MKMGKDELEPRTTEVALFLVAMTSHRREQRRMGDKACG
jgi:hypothetical protein